MFLEPCPFCSAEFVASDPLGAETMLGHHVLIGHRSAPGGSSSSDAESHRVRAAHDDGTFGGPGPST
jgi:hypothetical protein